MAMCVPTPMDTSPRTKNLNNGQTVWVSSPFGWLVPMSRLTRCVHVGALLGVANLG